MESELSNSDRQLLICPSPTGSTPLKINHWPFCPSEQVANYSVVMPAIMAKKPLRWSTTGNLKPDRYTRCLTEWQLIGHIYEESRKCELHVFLWLVCGFLALTNLLKPWCSYITCDISHLVRNTPYEYRRFHAGRVKLTHCSREICPVSGSEMNTEYEATCHNSYDGWQGPGSSQNIVQCASTRTKFTYSASKAKIWPWHGWSIWYAQTWQAIRRLGGVLRPLWKRVVSSHTW